MTAPDLTPAHLEELARLRAENEELRRERDERQSELDDAVAFCVGIFRALGVDSPGETPFQGLLAGTEKITALRSRVAELEEDLADVQKAFDTVSYRCPSKWADDPSGYIAELEAALRDFADHGLRADPYPTRHSGVTADQFYTAYLKRVDDSVRHRAKEALNAD